MIAVTGATGQLGRIVVKELLDRGVDRGKLAIVVRDKAKAKGLGLDDVDVRVAQYEDSESLDAALVGVHKLLLISGSEVGQRVAQHENVIEAAKAAGVGLLAYTSILRAQTTPMLLAGEHKATEEMIEGSGVPYVFLRNGWYTENYTRDLEATVERGYIAGCADGGRISAAPRGDYAAAAAAVLAGSGHEGGVYELGGDQAFTMSELAARVTEMSGSQVEYRDMTVEEYRKVLEGVGLPAPAAKVFADSDAAVGRGDLYTDSGDLSRLIGRPTTSLATVLAREFES